MVLDSQPTADVTIDVTSGDTGEGTVSASGSTAITDGVQLTFTTANWDTAQTVTVTGQDDTTDDGDVEFTITLAAGHEQ